LALLLTNPFLLSYADFKSSYYLFSVFVGFDVEKAENRVDSIRIILHSKRVGGHSFSVDGDSQRIKPDSFRVNRHSKRVGGHSFSVDEDSQRTGFDFLESTDIQKELADILLVWTETPRESTGISGGS